MRFAANYIIMLCLCFCIAEMSCKSKENNNRGDSVIIKDTLDSKTRNNILASIKQVKELSNFVTTLNATELSETLKRPGPFTVFAPNNAAFDQLPGIMDKNRNALTNLIGNHIVAGELKTNDLKDGLKLKTVGGYDLVVSFKNNTLKINGANVINRDLASANGIIFIIDKILAPKNDQ